MTEGSSRNLDALTDGNALSLEELVDREALREVINALAALVGLPLRLYGRDGSLVADAAAPPELYAYVNSFPVGRDRIGQTIEAIKAKDLGPVAEADYACITGVSYRILAVEYDGSTMGRAVIGPYRTPSSEGLAQSLLDAVPELDAHRVEQLTQGIPLVDPTSLEQLSSYLRRTLDLVLFSGHKALLTTNMHLVSVRESYRELRDKNGKLQHAYERLKELDRLKSSFLATVSHELRTPLTSVIGYSEMLSAGIAGELNAEQREFVETIRQKGEQLLELIKGLIDLSRLESGTMSLHKQQVDVRELVIDATDTLRPLALKKGIALLPRVDDTLPAIWADVGRLRQVVLNLGENAIKFTPPGGQVELSASSTTCAAPSGEDAGPLVLSAAPRRAVELRVADSGIGIPEPERERVFDSFYQIDSGSTRQQGGAGLGLAIVKRLVEAHDGSVRIESNRPRGVVVTVTIPVRTLSPA